VTDLVAAGAAQGVAALRVGVFAQRVIRLDKVQLLPRASALTQHGSPEIMAGVGAEPVGEFRRLVP